MGVCFSKKNTGAVAPFGPGAHIGSGVSEQRDFLSARNLVLGRHERTLRARQFLPYDAHTMQKPTAPIGQPWTDETFPHVFQRDREGNTIKLTWKRVKDFASNGKLFGNDFNRYCVKQGQVSDCFFISTLSAIADHPEYIKQIFPEDAYETDPSKYTGIVHCRFWWMGEWIDVYTDDILPCHDDLDRFVGVHSDDKNIVWAPLAEKALARLYGSYPKIAGNQLEVFRLLTGGIVQDYKTSIFTRGGDYLSRDKLFERVYKVLKSGSTVLTSISKDVAERKLNGLVSNHAYSVTDALKIEHQKKVTRLLRIRNPWGEKEETGKVNDGEWKGRWSYTSTEWKEVDKTLRKQHNVNFDEGGEFWVCMDDFFKLFENLYICDRIPNFDRDGFRKEDGLDKVINILGEWRGARAAGNEDLKMMRPPRFILSIPEVNDAKAICAVIEITRQFENPASSTEDKGDRFSVIDMFKVCKEIVPCNRTWMFLTTESVVKSYIGNRTTTYLCRLSPGDHLLLPYYNDNYGKPPVSKSFCIRIFTKVNATCRFQTEVPIMVMLNPLFRYA